MKKATEVTFFSSQIPSACAEGRLPVVVGFPFDQGGSFDPALHRYPSGPGEAHEAPSHYTPHAVDADMQDEQVESGQRPAPPRSVRQGEAFMGVADRRPNEPH